MKKSLSKIAIGACAAGMALSMAGCAGTTEAPSDTSPEGPAETSPSFDPGENVPEALYGPPEMFEQDPVFDPGSNQNEDVYGPPEMLGAIDGDGNIVVEEAEADGQDGAVADDAQGSAE